MIGLLCFVLAVLASPFKSKLRLEAENAVLRHQLIVLRRKLRGRVQLANSDRWFLVQLYRCFPSILKVLTIIRPETLVRWHRAGFRSYWRWKSRPQGGRPQIDTELRALIRQMSVENPLWGAPRIHGELLKLGIEVAQSSVAKYMVKRRGPPSQGWRTFLRNHAPDVAAMDLFVVPTIGFDLLYAFIIVRLDRRDLVWINVTTDPTAEWVVRQITEAFPWDGAPGYMIRDRDRIYGTVVTRRLRAMGIRDRTYAKITDNRPDEPRHRPHIDVGTEIEIPNNKLKWDKSNPTGHGAVFLSRAGYVFCYVQPGGVSNSALWTSVVVSIFDHARDGSGRAFQGWDGAKQKTALLPAPFWCTYTWNRPTSTGAGGSDPLRLCWRGKPWLAIRWRGYAASKWSQLERQLILLAHFFAFSPSSARR